MVSLAPDNAAAHQFVAQFNESLAAAKLDALAILRDYIAGAESASLPRDRERRLAASQVLRTPFLRIDQAGDIRDDRRSAPRGHRDQPGQRRDALDIGLVDATNGTPTRESKPQPASDPSAASTLPQTQGNSSSTSSVPSVCSVVKSPPDRLRGIDHKRAVKQALAAMRAASRAPT